MAYFRKKTIKGNDYWYLVKGVRKGDKVHQKFVAYLGRDTPVERESVRRERKFKQSHVARGHLLYRTGQEFIVFDCETTGFSPESGDKIIEVGFQKFRIEDGELVEGDVFHSYVNPKRSIPWKISELTGIKPDLVRDKPPIEGLIGHISEYIGDLPVVGHNVAFDFRFLNHDLSRNGRETVSEERIIDTLNISRVLYGRRPAEPLDKHNLRHCAMRERSASFSLKEYHSASHDVTVTAEVFASMMGKV